MIRLVLFLFIMIPSLAIAKSANSRCVDTLSKTKTQEGFFDIITQDGELVKKPLWSITDEQIAQVCSGKPTTYVLPYIKDGDFETKYKRDMNALSLTTAEKVEAFVKNISELDQFLIKTETTVVDIVLPEITCSQSSLSRFCYHPRTNRDLPFRMTITLSKKGKAEFSKSK